MELGAFDLLSLCVGLVEVNRLLGHDDIVCGKLFKGAVWGSMKSSSLASGLRAAL